PRRTGGQLIVQGLQREKGLLVALLTFDGHQENLVIQGYSMADERNEDAVLIARGNQEVLQCLLDDRLERRMGASFSAGRGGVAQLNDLVERNVQAVAELVRQGVDVMAAGAINSVTDGVEVQVVVDADEQCAAGKRRFLVGRLAGMCVR